MRVSHEVPLHYLEYSKQFNEYDYALVHLFPNNPEYLDFFKQSVKEGREVLLDNSAYEIYVHPELAELYPDGYFPNDQYVKYIEELKPTYYVLPDVKDHGRATIDAVKAFLEKYPNLPGKSIGVVHGENIEEMQKCYDTLCDLCDKIAFAFEDWWFPYAKKNNINLSHIRMVMVCQLKINKHKPHHMLGCLLPQEFKLWRGVSWVDTIDTSAPITNAIEGKEIVDDMMDKPQTTIHNSFLLEFDEKIAELMKENARKFYEYYVSVSNLRDFDKMVNKYRP